MSLPVLNGVMEKIMSFLKENTFLPLTSDLAFKAFFENQEDLIISMLESFLPLPKDSKILNAQLLNPEIYPQKLQGKANNLLSDKPGKLFILDLKIKFERTLPNQQKQIDISNVEMQTTVFPHLTSRVIAYVGRLHSQQLGSGDDFSQLCRVYSILFIKGKLPVFKNVRDYYHVCRLKREGSEDVVFAEDLNFVVIELGKFDKVHN